MTPPLRRRRSFGERERRSPSRWRRPGEAREKGQGNLGMSDGERNVANDEVEKDPEAKLNKRSSDSDEIKTILSVASTLHSNVSPRSICPGFKKNETNI